MKYFFNLTKSLVIFILITLSTNLKSQTPLTFNNNTGNHKFSDIGNWEDANGNPVNIIPGPNDKIKIELVDESSYSYQLNYLKG